MPCPVGALIVPSRLTVTGGSMMSSSQYLSDAETSPGRLKPGSVDSAILCARPIPASSMPPHHTGRPWSCAKDWMALASLYPPPPPNLMFLNPPPPPPRAGGAVPGQKDQPPQQKRGSPFPPQLPLSSKTPRPHG